MDKERQVRLKCIFCDGLDFEILYEDYEPKENENIKCSNCGKLNIYSDIKQIALEKELKIIKGEIIDNFQKDLKKMFKNNKNIQNKLK